MTRRSAAQPLTNQPRVVEQDPANLRLAPQREELGSRRGSIVVWIEVLQAAGGTVPAWQTKVAGEPALVARVIGRGSAAFQAHVVDRQKGRAPMS